MRGNFFLLLIVIALLCTGCTARAHYDWGSYNETVHRMYTSGPDYEIGKDIEILGSELSRSQPEKIPPGKAAHLGFLYSIRGENDRAREYFSLEKKLFPESAVLMDRLIARLR